ncbi:MAG: hypothetical protein JJE27_06745 [Thermoleophilia bacterium]|nr:hypothetical protein [Thermoleophilia bacterium]
MALLIAGAWGLTKVVLVQFERRLDQRFDTMEKSRKDGQRVWDERFKGMEGRLSVQERDLSSHMASLPVQYVRREDAIRSDVQVNAKLDALNERLDVWLLRQAEKGQS